MIRSAAKSTCTPTATSSSSTKPLLMASNCYVSVLDCPGCDIKAFPVEWSWQKTNIRDQVSIVLEVLPWFRLTVFMWGNTWNALLFLEDFHLVAPSVVSRGGGVQYFLALHDYNVVAYDSGHYVHSPGQNYCQCWWGHWEPERHEKLNKSQ